MIADPSAGKVTADLADPDLRRGAAASRWRILGWTSPLLDFAVAATEPDGRQSEYCFQAELTNYPVQAPMVRIWTPGGAGPLPRGLRPTGGQRVSITFQVWAEDTVYRPWDRKTGPHNGNGANFPHLAWRPDRRLAFILEDLHGILNGNARAHRLRSAA